jgi:hypothetical protein
LLPEKASRCTRPGCFRQKLELNRDFVFFLKNNDACAGKTPNPLPPDAEPDDPLPDDQEVGCVHAMQNSRE